ncbi:endonuclease domain-containing protein [Rhodopirellula halodulae]|uniref:endonuclease domain-containing protein n=1 Tax=Rhodopirellula halodulae TaxID=2894198 RepID=UPI001E63AC6A|nr:endonuclease domain-containing protein [Rhodopirellula sp. JC737]MCC9655570.1 endonuclease domain-containing protein [Rhodopirellula sp. JC737]
MRRNPERQAERIEFAREQRHQANEFSVDVWQMVRAGRMLGEKFRREHPLGSYTLDFVCLRLRLVIEVDGKHHLNEEGVERDAVRDRFLKDRGFTVLRIRGFEVTQDGAAVRRRIEEVVRRLQGDAPSPPTPLPEAGRGEPGI